MVLDVIDHAVAHLMHPSSLAYKLTISSSSNDNNINIMLL